MVQLIWRPSTCFSHSKLLTTVPLSGATKKPLALTEKRWLHSLANVAKCNVGKVKLQANAVSGLLLKRMWSEGCLQGPFAYLVTYVASHAGIFELIFADLLLSKSLRRVVTKISSCRVNTTSKRGIKWLGISFGSIFLLFSNKSSRGPLS